MIAKGAGTPPEENICQRKDMWKGKRVSIALFYSGFPTRVPNPFKCLIFLETSATWYV
jgi:hypothetical protein